MKLSDKIGLTLFATTVMSLALMRSWWWMDGIDVFWWAWVY